MCRSVAVDSAVCVLDGGDDRSFAATPGSLTDMDNPTMLSAVSMRRSFAQCREFVPAFKHDDLSTPLLSKACIAEHPSNTELRSGKCTRWQSRYSDQCSSLEKSRTSHSRPRPASTSTSPHTVPSEPVKCIIISTASS
jgi:hypothetical protein